MEAVDKTKTGISTVTSDALLKVWGLRDAIAIACSPWSIDSHSLSFTLQIQDAVDEAQGEDKEEELIKMKKLEEVLH